MAIKNQHEISVKTNYIFNIAIQLLTYIIPLITSPYLSRVLSPEGIGENSYTNSIATYFVLAISYGFVTYGTEKIAKSRKNKEEYSMIFWNIFFTRFVLFVFSFLIYAVLISTWCFGAIENRLLFWTYSISLITAFVEITYLYQGLEDFRIVSIINIIVRIIGVACIFLFVKQSSDLFIYILIFTGQSLIVAAICWIFALNKIDKPHFNQIHIISCLKQAFLYFLPTIAISVYTILDRTMLGGISTKQEVGYYEEAYKIIVLITSLVNSISPVMLSHISLLIKENREDEIKRKIIQMAEVYFLISLPSIMGLYVVSRYFFPAFFGIEYIPSIRVAYVLAPLVLIIPISNQIGAVYFVPRGKINQITVFFFIGAIINFILNFFMIKSYGAVGAALTSLLAEFIISSLYVIFSFKYLPYKLMLKMGIKPFISSLIMVFILIPFSKFVLDRLFENYGIKTTVLIVMGIVIYSIMLLILKENMVVNVIKRVFKRKR